MADEDLNQALALLSVAIGGIMEDEATSAVMVLPRGREERARRFANLAKAGEDITALAEAAAVLLRRFR